MKCPKHGFERFTIKVVKRFNMKPYMIEPKFRSRPKTGLSCLLIGRNVSYREIENYLINYFRERGLWEGVLRIKLQV